MYKIQTKINNFKELHNLDIYNIRKIFIELFLYKKKFRLF